MLLTDYLIHLYIVSWYASNLEIKWNKVIEILGHLLYWMFYFFSNKHAVVTDESVSECSISSATNSRSRPEHQYATWFKRPPCTAAATATTPDRTTKTSERKGIIAAETRRTKSPGTISWQWHFLILRVPITIVADDILKKKIFSENKSSFFMWIVCLADDSQEISRLIFFRK